MLNVQINPQFSRLRFSWALHTSILKVQHFEIMTLAGNSLWGSGAALAFLPFALRCQPVSDQRWEPAGRTAASSEQIGLCVPSTNAPLLSEGMCRTGADPARPAVCGSSISRRETSASSVSLLKRCCGAIRRAGAWTVRIFVSPSLPSAVRYFSCVTGLPKVLCRGFPLWSRLRAASLPRCMQRCPAEPLLVLSFFGSWSLQVFSGTSSCGNRWEMTKASNNLCCCLLLRKVCPREISEESWSWCKESNSTLFLCVIPYADTVEELGIFTSPKSKLFNWSYFPGPKSYSVFPKHGVACSTSYLQQQRAGMSGTVVLGFASVVGVAPLALSQLPSRGGGGGRHLKAVAI